MNFKVKVSNQTFDVQIENIKSILATVDGEVFEVHVEAETTTATTGPSTPTATAAVSAATPALAASSSGANAVKAPIPGVITAVKVKVGDTVAPGDELCNLEAMKMNNAIRCTKAGTISAVLITQGDHVAHGQVLFELAG
jgi:biotin carboxyl carrier protein